MTRMAARSITQVRHVTQGSSGCQSLSSIVHFVEFVVHSWKRNKARQEVLHLAVAPSTFGRKEIENEEAGVHVICWGKVWRNSKIGRPLSCTDSESKDKRNG